MCIHTHTDSKLMRKLTAVMLATYAARPVTLVNYNKEPHDHFTLYASGAEGAQRALDLLNAWHPRYAGNLAAFTDNDFPRLRSRMVPASFPSIEWPEKPSAPFVAAVCYAYGTMTHSMPSDTECFAYANDKLSGDALQEALQLIRTIRGIKVLVDTPVAEPFDNQIPSEPVAEVDTQVAAEPAAPKFDWLVEYNNVNGDRKTARHGYDSAINIGGDGVLGFLDKDDMLFAIYKDWNKAVKVPAR